MAYEFKTEKKFKSAGIKKITLPMKREDVTITRVQKKLGEILNLHKDNAEKIKYYLDIVSGEFQPIDLKTRKFEQSLEHNNKSKMNHAYALVTFKEGFVLGEKREYAQKAEIMTDDLLYLEKFLTDCNFYTKDLEVKHNMYSTGIATSYITPRTDIITNLDENKARYKTIKEGYDVDNDSPFIYECIDSTSNGVVYSSYIGQQDEGALFCFNLFDEFDKNDEVRQFCKVITHEWTCVFDEDNEIVEGTYKSNNPYYTYLPIIEHSFNSKRLGIIELVYDLLHNINVIVSNSLDNLVDVVNHILVFLSCSVESKDLIEMLEKGAIMIPQQGSNSPSVDKISLEVNHAQINIFFEEILTRCYDIAGVPLASANVTSGGDTGQARLLGGGWTNAYTIAKRDILAMQESDRGVLRRFIQICQMNPENKVDEISPNQVEIKYNINMTDNLLSKTQSIQSLAGVGMPFEDILRAVPLYGDVKTISKRWEHNVAQMRELDREDKILEQSTEKGKSEQSSSLDNQTEKS